MKLKVLVSVLHNCNLCLADVLITNELITSVSKRSSFVAHVDGTTYMPKKKSKNNNNKFKIR